MADPRCPTCDTLPMRAPGFRAELKVGNMLDAALDLDMKSHMALCEMVCEIFRDCKSVHPSMKHSTSGPCPTCGRAADDETIRDSQRIRLTELLMHETEMDAPTISGLAASICRAVDPDARRITSLKQHSD